MTPGSPSATTSPSRRCWLHLERFGSTTRVRSNGARLHPDSQGLIVAAFRQTTSRADDPQLHTHVVISAKVQTVDGRWLALDARVLKRLPAGPRWLVSVGAARRTDLTATGSPSVRSSTVRPRSPASRASCWSVFSKRTVEVESAVDGQGCRVLSARGSRPDPLGTRRDHPPSSRRHPCPQDRTRRRRSADTLAGRGRRSRDHRRRSASTSVAAAGRSQSPGGR